VNPETEELSGELAAELAANENARSTRDVPVRNYALKAMGRSPAHCRHAMLSSFDGPNLTQRLGSAVHSLLLGGPDLIVFPGKVRRGKAFDEFELEHAGKIICSRAEYETANRTAQSVRNDRLATEVLYAKGNRHEHTLHWEWLGRSRRCTPDIDGPGLLAELKTTQNASPDKFKWDVLRYGYINQLADYANALLTTKSYAPRDVFIVAVEKTAPYVCSVYRVAPRDIERGLNQCRAWMERLLVCEATDEWPGYCSSVMDLELPGDDDGDLIFGDEDVAA
jgi:hypothetical protein